MSHNWSVVTDKIYGIIKGSCKKLTMYDAAGNETIDPDDATRFFGTVASHDSKLDKICSYRSRLILSLQLCLFLHSCEHKYLRQSIH